MFRLEEILGLLLVFTAFTNGFKFPSDIPRCKLTDAECLRTVATGVLRTYATTGHQGLNLAPYEPFYFKTFPLGRIYAGPLDLQLDLCNGDITGSQNATILSLSGFTKEASNLVLEMLFYYPKFILSGHYSIEGSVFEHPIAGEGHGAITFEDTIIATRIKCSTRVKRGRTYLNVDGMDVDIRPYRVTFALQDIFNGNKALGSYVNRLMNERSSHVFDQLKSSIERTLGGFGTVLIGGPFAAIPYDEFFL